MSNKFLQRFNRYVTELTIAKNKNSRYITVCAVTQTGICNDSIVPKLIQEDDLIVIEDAIRIHENGASITGLAGRDASNAKRRSIHRRLAKLIDLGRVKQTGTGKGTKYYLADTSKQAVVLHKEEAHLEAEGGLFVPLSIAGQELQRAIHKPVGERKPVSYEKSFLIRYNPNVTFYLSRREREYLAQIGNAQEGVQPAGTYARQILNRLLIDLSWNSSRLEGNTYSILDTYILLEKGKHAEGKSAEEAQMILNHKDAIEFLVESANDIGFNRHTILNLHSLLSHNLLPDPYASGRLRTKIVGIGQSAYIPLATPAVLEECFNDLLAKASAIADPFEQAFFVSVQLPYLQPFEDVNKRVSRLAANIPLIKKNLSPLSFVDVPETLYKDAMLSIYELNRTELARDAFVWAYERSTRRYAAIRQSLGEPDLFRLRYRDPLRTAISSVIQERLPKSRASTWIEEWSSTNVPPEDRDRFIEVAESELIGLHEGNFARYKVRPSEFYAWKQVWESGAGG